MYALLVSSLLNNQRRHYYQAIFANLLATLITLIIGSIWLKIIINISWLKAFYYGFLPFILPGLIKATIAAIIGGHPLPATE